MFLLFSLDRLRQVYLRLSNIWGALMEIIGDCSVGFLFFCGTFGVNPCLSLHCEALLQNV